MLSNIDSIDQNIWNRNCPVANQYFNYLKQESFNKNSSIATLQRFKILLPCKTECRLDDFQLFNISTINQTLNIMAFVPNASKCYDTLFNETIRLTNLFAQNAIGIFLISFLIKLYFIDYLKKKKI